MFSDFFEAIPKVIPANQTSTIVLRPRFMQRKISYLTKDSTLKLQMVPVNGLFDDGALPDYDEFRNHPFEIPSGDPDCIRFSIHPEQEGEYFFRLTAEKDGRKEKIVEFSFYALEKDLYNLKPYRGDLHVHTSYSGCASRLCDPKFVAVCGRMAGLDFMSVNDHIQYLGSVEAQRYIQSVKTGLQLYRGEECHILRHQLPEGIVMCQHPVLTQNHICSVGATEGVIKYSNDHYEEYMRDVTARAEKLPKSMKFDVRFCIAAADWVVDMIHKFGGIAIFAHPFWRANERLNMPVVARDYMLDHVKFDAVEVVPGATHCDDMRSKAEDMECTMSGVAWWQDACIRRGAMIPLVGCTDCHDSRKILGVNYTIAFAKDSGFESIADAIRSGYSVACRCPKGQPRLPSDTWSAAAPAIYGSLRLVRYAYFLERAYFPEHNERCRLEGLKMLAELTGEENCKPEDYGHLY